MHRKIGVYKMSNNWKALTQFYCTLLYTQLYAYIQNCWMIPRTQLLYHVTVCCLNPIKKSLLGRRPARYVPNIAHFNLLLWSDENTVSRKSLNAVSLGVPSANCAYIILIHSAVSPVWYFINILLFHVKNLFNWFPKYIW